MAAATESRRSGLSDFLKAYFARLEEKNLKQHDLNPNNLSLSDNTLASLVNFALNLDVEELIEATFMKRFRQNKSKLWVIWPAAGGGSGGSTFIVV